MDDIQSTAEQNPRTTPTGYEAHTPSASRGGATGTRHSSRQQKQDMPLRSRPDSDEPRMLPTSPGRKQNPPLKKPSVVDLDDYANDSSEEQEAVEFTKNAAERRRSGKDSSSPDRRTSKVRTGVESLYFTPERQTSGNSTAESTIACEGLGARRRLSEP